MEATKRRYDNARRAAAAQRTRQAVLEAARGLFTTASYDDVSLADVAAQAGVALKTVLRLFESKDQLLLACGQGFRDLETRARGVTPGDVTGAARVLAARYEAIMDMTRRHLSVEERSPVVAELLALARRGHWAWLADTFAPVLPRRGTALHRRRVAELFGVTEIYVWHSWRRRLGLSRRVAEDALREMLLGLVRSWGGAEHG